MNRIFSDFSDFLVECRRKAEKSQGLPANLQNLVTHCHTSAAYGDSRILLSACFKDSTTCRSWTGATHQNQRKCIIMIYAIVVVVLIWCPCARYSLRGMVLGCAVRWEWIHALVCWSRGPELMHRFRLIAMWLVNCGNRVSC